MLKQILIATKNKGKIKEFESFFLKYGIEVLSLYDLDKNFSDIEETGETFEENAAIKAEEISKLLNKAVLADDSGLMVDALDGAPGIFSARYAGEDKSDTANNEKLLKELASIPEEERTAKFVCTLAIARPNEETIFKTGYCHGKVTLTLEGEHGFGYDPLFIPNGYNQTMAELSPEEKNKISHRSEAMKQLEEWLKVL